MASVVEAIAALALATSITTAGFVGYADPFSGVEGETLRAQLGISKPVYDCATDVLAGKDVDGLVAFIENEAATAGGPEETPTAKALRYCVYKDPFGWYGTENEWAIELLHTETWK